jgi:DNA repair exonuclease SbcCD ATPase subunit
MIRHIRLQHWRAYDQLDLPLTHPITFFVAPNGVGKSSLVEAVRWALLGAPEERARGRAVRNGHESAAVELHLEVPGHPDIQVTRSLKRTGASTFAATIEGEVVTESQYLATLSQAWVADTALLDAVIFGPTLTSKVTAFPIRDQLAAVFGIDPLLTAATALKVRRDTLAARIKSVRDDLSGTADAITSAEQTVSELQTDVTAAETQRREAAASMAELEDAADLAEEWQRYRSAARDYSLRTHSLISEMSGIITVGGDDPREVLAATERQVSAALDESIAGRSAAEIRAAQAATAADLLGSASGRCPTCLRPLSDHERDAALAAHGHETGGARNEIEQHELETTRARQRLAAISRFGTAFGDLRAPTEPGQPDPGPHATDDVNEARQRLSDLAEAHGGLIARLRAAQEHLKDLRDAAADQATLTTLAQEDLLLEVAHKSITTVADRYLTERIEPLATQIGHTWKLLFGAEGLQFASDGQLSVNHGENHLELSDLSGGERATALLITRLMLAASATQASTLWLDEPLEHLDPTRRAAVAQTLTRAVQAGAVEQILVTTYEEGLARRLEATAPDVVALTYARSTTPSFSTELSP